MWRNVAPKSCFRESIKALEADVHHANTLAASLRRDWNGDYIQMKLNYSPFAPLFLYLIEWMDFSCTDALPTFLGLVQVFVDGVASKGRRASLREFYAVIYPSLRQLEAELIEMESFNNRKKKKRVEEEEAAQMKLSSEILERDEECGICFENCSKIVLPDCGHSMCISCFHGWNGRSESCPFCRGSLERINSRDLWILTSDCDIVDREIIVMENLSRFYLYIHNLPLLLPESHVFMLDFLL